VTTHSEVRPEVASERANVRSARTLDAHLEVEKLPSRHGLELERGNRHGPRLELYLEAGAGEVVCPLAVDLDRAVRARHLLDRTGESRNPLADRLIFDGPGVCGRRDVALCVIRCGRLAKPNGREVLLVESDEEGEQAGRATDPEEQ
jgi:hypothetical protein